MSYEFIRYDVEDHVATLTLHRPDRLNAMTVPTIVECLDAIDRVDADDDVRCVIVTGAGRAFCAGADLQDGRDTFASDTWAEEPHIAPFRLRDGGGILTLRIYRSPKPFIAAINGSAVGFGLTLTLPMDIRLCAEDAKLGFVFARRGLVLDASAGWFLPRIVSMTWATDWAYTGRLFTPAEALRAGLVRDVYPGAGVLEAARDLARQIAEANPVSVSFNKALLWHASAAPTPWDAHRMETAALKTMGPRDDTAEGIRAFNEKRAPRFASRVSTDMPPGYAPWEEPAWEPLPIRPTRETMRAVVRNGVAMDMIRRHRLAGTNIAALALPLAIAGILVPFRANFANAAAALILVAVIVAMGVIGDRTSGFLATVSATVWFDLLLTRPYERFAISHARDIETTVSLFVVGLVITELAARNRHHHAAANEESDYVGLIYRISELAASGAPRTEVIDRVRTELTALLHLRACRYVSGPPERRATRIEDDGEVLLAGALWDVDQFGLPGPEIELLAKGQGRTLGRFVLTPTPGFPVSHQRRVVAVALADQVGAILRPELRLA